MVEKWKERYTVRSVKKDKKKKLIIPVKSKEINNNEGCQKRMKPNDVAIFSRKKRTPFYIYLFIFLNNGQYKEKPNF